MSKVHRRRFSSYTEFSSNFSISIRHDEDVVWSQTRKFLLTQIFSVNFPLELSFVDFTQSVRFNSQLRFPFIALNLIRQWQILINVIKINISTFSQILAMGKMKNFFFFNFMKFLWFFLVNLLLLRLCSLSLLLLLHSCHVDFELFAALNFPIFFIVLRCLSFFWMKLKYERRRWIK